jgi:hypothetical protein
LGREKVRSSLVVGDSPRVLWRAGDLVVAASADAASIILIARSDGSYTGGDFVSTLHANPMSTLLFTSTGVVTLRSAV